MLSQSVEEKEGTKLLSIICLFVGDHEGKLFIDEWD